MANTMPEFQFKGSPLSTIETKDFINLLSSSNEHEKSAIEDIKLADEFLVKIMLKRIKLYKLSFELSNIFCVCCLIFIGKPNPAKIIMCLWLAKKYHDQHKDKKMLTIDDWTEIFPFGSPTENEWQEMWESQKKSDEPLGNMLDNIIYWS